MPQPRRPRADTPPEGWTFLGNHAHALFVLAEDPTCRLRDVAERVGITERAVARLVADLVAEGYVEVQREGRRNRYRVRGSMPLRHPLERHRTVHDLVQLILGAGTTRSRGAGRDR
jgi:Mn-dependent DtxR family transcriptional regulator